MTTNRPIPRPYSKSSTHAARGAQAEAFHVQPAQRADMDTVAGFIRSSADWYRPILDASDMDQHDVDDEWAETNFKKREFYLGMVGDEAVGTISIQHLADYMYLGYIYLNVEHVGHGYGRRLIEFAHQSAIARHVDGMALIAHPEARWATRAYEKYGFELAATERHDVLGWQDGALKPYYEEGFQLYTYSLDTLLSPARKCQPSQSAGALIHA